MTYEQALSYIKKAEKLGSMPGLFRITEILKHLGNPQDKCKVIHIAGTNGKGSTTTMVANVLQNAGYKVGKFMSPYVYEYGERICINNVMITPKEIVYYIEKIKKVTDLPEFCDLQPTEFEVNTLIAFLHYAENECDYVALEVGLGGTLDATNVIKNPLINVITSISLDHTHILGDNVCDIAREKCGIIKDCPVVCYPLQQDGVIDVVKSYASDAVLPDLAKLTIKNSDIFGSDIIFEDKNYKVSLAGEHQVYNAISVIKICDELIKLGVGIKYEHVFEALSTTKINARMEIVSQEPIIIIDGSHNVSGIEFLCKNVSKLIKNKRVCIVFGMLADKDYKTSLGILEKNFEDIIITEVNYFRGGKLEGEFAHKTTKSVEESIDFAQKEGFEAIIVCGSLFLAKDAKEYAKKYIQMS